MSSSRPTLEGRSDGPVSVSSSGPIDLDALEQVRQAGAPMNVVALSPDPPEVSPAVQHALWSGRPHTAGAIHILDGIGSDLLPRDAVTMDGIDWDPIVEMAPRMSSGEAALIGAAHYLDRAALVRWSALDDVRRLVDADGNRRLDQALAMASQRIPLGGR